jgi:hypothetical protein
VWEEIGSWSEDLKTGALVMLTLITVVLIISTSIVAYRNATTSMMKWCLSEYTPRQCAVLEMTGSEIERIEE